MTNYNYPLATSTWDTAEYAAIKEVTKKGRFTMGPEVLKFEQEFAHTFGSTFAVMVNSGSSANLALIAAAVLNPEIDLNEGDEVIVPAVSWPTTYYPLKQYGLIPHFVDIDSETLNLSIDSINNAINSKTKAIFAVNLLGNPNNFEKILELCSANGLILFEDNCESLGAKYKGKSCGTFGLGGTFSTFFSHHISTMEGGVVLTDDLRTYQTMVSLRAHGWTRELPQDNLVFPKTGDDFDDLFRFVLPGYNLRPLEMSGAIGVAQLQKVPDLISGRRENANYFVNKFSDLEGIKIQRETGESSWFGFALTLVGKFEGKRAEFVKALTREGIESRPIVAGNFTKNPVMSYLNGVQQPLPNADHIHSNGLFIGNHHYNVHDGIDHVFDVINDLNI